MDLFIQSRGKTKAWILPYVNTQLFNRVLADFAREFQLNTNKRALLILDQAGWHISHQLQLPEGLDWFFLPAYSPELLVVRCKKLLKQHDLIQGLTCYHWWSMTRTA